MFSALAWECQLPATFLLRPAVSCSGCIGRLADEEKDAVVGVKQVLTPTPLKERAAGFQLPSSFYNPCNLSYTGYTGCHDIVKEEDWVHQ